MEPPLPSDDPPIDQWSRVGAQEAFRRLIAELILLEPEEAVRRLDRLSEEQRAWVLRQLDRWDPT